jgi:hypothetical protein
MSYSRVGSFLGRVGMVVAVAAVAGRMVRTVGTMVGSFMLQLVVVWLDVQQLPK